MKKIKYIVNYIKIKRKDLNLKKKIKSLLKGNETINYNYKKEISSYWNSYNIKHNIQWHKWYTSINGIADKKYIPENIFYCYIEPYYNNISFDKAYSDKAILKKIFPNIKQPNTVVINVAGIFYDDNYNIISNEKAIELCSRHKDIIIKPTIESGGGKDIEFINLNKISCLNDNLNKIFLKFNKNFIVQEVISQHEKLKCINPESVNTVRVMSYLRGEDVYILSSVLRMGINGNRVDNSAFGGISCGISHRGYLKKYAYDKHGKKFTEHPQGFIFDNKEVPYYDRIIELIKKEHKKIAHFKLISWDFAIDKLGNPILLEYNLSGQEINFHQLNNGPLFGKLTENILNEVFNENF
ncbi:hypothetical protein LIZ77_13935 [Clostridium perfringens]|uniref:sugar-transfer associated ATP-grasp domain-containing protein n=1 Tax=Clostridium perfringens TaxID=1502 RepID=UPI0022478B13|nr:sugar-transfer associated ATP-grasp domain-containing protein [Clostridium perfringens]MCX0371850.1 hypothetical protein [Clostridium perfringens]